MSILSKKLTGNAVCPHQHQRTKSRKDLFLKSCGEMKMTEKIERRMKSSYLEKFPGRPVCFCVSHEPIKTTEVTLHQVEMRSKEDDETNLLEKRSFFSRVATFRNYILTEII